MTACTDWPSAAPARDEADTIAVTLQREGALVASDVRDLVLRVVRDARAGSDALLILSDALIELADAAATACLHVHARGCRRLAALVAELAPHRTG